MVQGRGEDLGQGLTRQAEDLRELSFEPLGLIPHQL